MPKFFKYSLIAGLSALTDWLVFVALVTGGVWALSAQIVARVTGGVTSFWLNRTWSFGSNGKLARQSAKFLLLYGVSYALSLSIFALAMEYLNPYYSKLIADTVCFLFNFFCMKHFVFHADDEPLEVPGKPAFPRSKM